MSGGRQAPIPTLRYNIQWMLLLLLLFCVALFGRDAFVKRQNPEFWGTKGSSLLWQVGSRCSICNSTYILMTTSTPKCYETLSPSKMTDCDCSFLSWLIILWLSGIFSRDGITEYEVEWVPAQFEKQLPTLPIRVGGCWISVLFFI